MNKEFQWDDETIKKLLHAATGNIKDFVMNEDGFLADFKASHTEVKRDWDIWSFIEKDEYVADGDDPFILPVSTIPSCYNIEMYLADDSCFNIHSVRRVEDKELFYVGDKVNSTWGLQKITRFFVDGNEMIVEFATCRNPLSKISKPLQRTPLFVSKDNWDVYDGTKLWSVGKLTFEIGMVGEKMTPLLQKGHHDHYYYFVNESAAKEYVILNKPFMSVQEVMNRVGAYFKLQEFAFENLKEFAKQKLDKQ